MAASTITRTTWTDDDGSGTTGSIVNNSELQKVYDAINQMFSGTGAYATFTFGGLLAPITAVADTTSIGISMRGRSSDSVGTCAFYNNTGATRYGYIQSTSTGGGSLSVVAEGATGVVNLSATVSGKLLTLTSAGLMTFDGVVNVTGFGTHVFVSSGTGAQNVRVGNTAAGTTNLAALQIQNDVDSAAGYIYHTSSTYTTGTIDKQNALIVQARQSGGMSIGATNASGAINFYAGGTSLKGSITSSEFIVGDSVTSAVPNYTYELGAGNALCLFTARDTTKTSRIELYGGGLLKIGNDNSSGGGLASGTSANSGVIATTTAADIHIVTNGSIRATFGGSSGALALTGFLKFAAGNYIAANVGSTIATFSNTGISGTGQPTSALQAGWLTMQTSAGATLWLAYWQ